MTRMTSFSLLGALLVVLAACPNRDVARVDPNPEKEEYKNIPTNINRNIDILFVIDNSLSMLEEQQSLGDNFNRFINILENIEGGLPNVHIGVISTDVGAGVIAGVPSCTGNGDNGALQNTARVPGCSPPTDAYIVDIEDGVGGRTTNYDGGSTLAETFSCIARLGGDGCGFEQPFESMIRALDGTNASNAGFLREDAYLAVIFISDEDDCSTEDPNMFGDPAAGIDSTLGHLSSFRCWEFGVQCDPDTQLRTAGAREDCIPRPDSPYMYHPDRYIDFLRGLKSDPSLLIVAGIIGNATPVVIGPDPMDPDRPALLPSCTSGAGEADPGTRIQYLLDAFPQRSTVTTICNEDLSDALTTLADLLAEVIGNPCLDGNVDTDPDTAGVQYDCVVSDVQNLNQDNQTETVLAACDSTTSPTNQPCWYLIGDAEVEIRAAAAMEAASYCCDEYETTPGNCVDAENQTLIIERLGDPPLNTNTIARCIVQ